MKVGIIGATGYTGQELARLLQNHPEIELAYLGSSSNSGAVYEEMFPQFSGLRSSQGMGSGLGTGKLDNEQVPDLDVLFCALPHGLTADRTAQWLNRGIKVIDLGADFRLKDATVYENWYKVKHPAKELIPGAVYGLPELYRDKIVGKALIANPGCYPTATLLALAPLLQKGLLQKDGLIIDAKSGVSGAGRGVTLGNHFSEVNENFKAYGVASHRHTPEIEQQLTEAAGSELLVNFTPHLVPMTRGILATIYAQVTPGVTEADLKVCWQEQYEGEEFVHILPEGIWPQTKFASGSNHSFLQLKVDSRTGRAILISSLDNLVKGASGQAIQNMNLICGLPENMGLKMRGLWP
ncbi:N-acetyl-gamma-glutamyl-phosphate reductase [Desulfitobacterium dehalogenans ATCC 51507]|uniref:N-acetyl-gamma-glutamyl-phosphate reductase n=1 Tax=Desulfitobacterium dehalogenans (strain ATCC 51507 / DSM 9161 / JW/IU-DC1) TaxID=756499 RepID=I4A554_DESDJ|nr:N-acetyl-gamma-glutamyl-phosphate reductase [Desulfitobacterium dehalogenans]AFL99088.1 N-acetyl-gamma-glutamyl-phosphate reductase [Desulfitobacterium dehalogenans ATCC 51507]